MGMTRLSKFKNFKTAIERNDWKQATAEKEEILDGTTKSLIVQKD